MEHLLLIYWILSFAAGFTVLIASILIYLKRKNELLKYYILLLSALTILILSSTIKNYIDINQISPDNLTIVLDIFFLFGETLLIAAVPIFTNSLFPYLKLIKMNKFFGILSIICFIITMINYFVKIFMPLTNIFLFILLIMTGLYSCITVLINFHKIVIIQVRLFSRALLISSILIFFALGIDSILNYKIKFSSIPGSFRVGPAIYLIWNLLSVYYFVQNLFFKEADKDIRQYYSLFCQKYGISEREKDILILLFEGYSNKLIGNKLFITTGTVKRHVHNIYEKTGVNGRIKLINMIRQIKLYPKM